MAFDPGFPNEDNDAHLVENKARIKPDYSILSTDSFPSLADADAGRILEHTDTGDRFRWSGTAWYQTHADAKILTVTELSSVTDSNNSTTALLGGGGVFTGTGVVMLPYAAVQVTAFADQDSAADGLSIQWSTDNSNWDLTEEYTITANEPFFVQAMKEGKYLRVVYTNGAVAQTEFRLQTICSVIPSIGEVQPVDTNISTDSDAQLVRAVITGKKPNGDYTNVNTTNGGNLKISLEEYESTFDTNQLPVREKSTTAFGEVLTGQLHPQFQGSFEYTVDNTDLNENTVVNGGTVTQASGMAVLSSSTTTASTALFESRRHARYKSGLGGVDRFTALFTAPVALTEQYIGLADEIGSSAAFKNGYMVGYDGTTFGFHRFQNDAKFTTILADWDDPLDGTGPSGATIDETKLNIFFIQYEYLGAGSQKIWYEKPNGIKVLVHTAGYANLFTEPSTHNPNFHHVMWVNNKATTSDLIIKSSSYAYFVEGKTDFIELHQPDNSSGTEEKTTVTTETAIFTIRNKATYATKTNFIDILMISGSVSIEASSANNLGKVRVVKNAALGGAPSYADINTTDSVVEIDIAGTTVTGGKELDVSLLAGKNDSDKIDLVKNKYILGPGETLTFAGSSANSATIDGQTTWRELF